MPLAALAPAWHDFFAIIGTAAATLIGAMFVVVSLGIGFLTRERSVAIRTFLTPTVTRMSTVLLGCALTMVPGLDGNWFAAISGLGGLAGIAYSGQVIWGFNQHEGTGHDDWFWYAIFPLAGYALLLAAAVFAMRDAVVSFDLFAAALGLLLIAGIRNAWDMILFLVTLDRGSG
jgi:hypothetical protein